MPMTEGIKKLIKENDNKITRLDLSNKLINDDDVKDLQELLKNNSYIESVDLSDNVITSDACKSLALFRVKKINLKGNYLGDKGVIELLSNQNIKELNISSNGLTDESASKLLVSINQYENLEINNNPRISSELLNRLRNKFIGNPTSFAKPIGVDLGLNISSSMDFSIHSQTIFSSLNTLSEANKLGKTIYQEHKNDFQKLTEPQMKELLQSMLSCLGVNLGQIELIAKEGSPSPTTSKKQSV